MGSELLRTDTINGHLVDIYGCWDEETPENTFEFYEAFLRETGECLNLGDPWYSGDDTATDTTPPSAKDVAEALTDDERLQ